MKNRIIVLFLAFIIIFLSACSNAAPEETTSSLLTPYGGEDDDSSSADYGKEKIAINADMNGDGIKDIITVTLSMVKTYPEHVEPPKRDTTSYLEAVIDNRAYRLSIMNTCIVDYEIKVIQGADKKDILIISNLSTRLGKIIAVTLNEENDELEFMPIPTRTEPEEFYNFGYMAEIKLIDEYMFELTCTDTGYTEKCSFAETEHGFWYHNYDSNGKLLYESDLNLDAVSNVSFVKYEGNHCLKIKQDIRGGHGIFGYLETIFYWDENKEIKVVRQKVRSYKERDWYKFS